MSLTEIKLNKNARVALEKGVDEVADTVKVSLGAEGKNVVIPHRAGGYIITKDGVSIAREINPEDKYAGIGAALIKEACHRTNREAGDGTTTSAVLTQAIFKEGLKMLDKGHSSVKIKKGIDKAIESVLYYLDYVSEEVTNKKGLKSVASISANNDEELGEFISEAFDSIGKHGLVLTEVSDTKKTSVEVKEGIQLDSGFLNTAFITDRIKDKCVLEDTFVLLHKGKIEKGDEVIKLLDSVFKTKEGKLLIITDDIDPFVLSVIIQNIESGSIAGKICVVKAPQILKIHKEMLGDIAAFTGASIVSDRAGRKIRPDVLGKLDKAVVTETSATLIGNVGNLSSTVSEIEQKIESTDNEFEKKDLQERLSRITGGVAVISVGAKTDSELKEKQDRIEDSINATRAALEEGIVAGGGVALYEAGINLQEEVNLIEKSSWIKRLFNIKGNSEVAGKKIVADACKEPLKQILENAAIKFNSGDYAVGLGEGTNVLTGEVINMIDEGIIDPKKVTRCALENAASVAGMFLTTEAVVSRLEK